MIITDFGEHVLRRALDLVDIIQGSTRAPLNYFFPRAAIQRYDEF